MGRTASIPKPIKLHPITTKELVEAIALYGRHLSSCPDRGISKDCTCGYTRLIGILRSEFPNQADQVVNSIHPHTSRA